MVCLRIHADAGKGGVMHPIFWPWLAFYFVMRGW